MSLIKLPKTVTMPLYVYMGVGRFVAEKLEVTSSNYSSTDPNFARIKLVTTEITLDLPQDIDSSVATKHLVGLLRKKKEDLGATYHMDCRRIDDEIGRLQALTFQPEGV